MTNPTQADREAANALKAYALLWWSRHRGSRVTSIKISGDGRVRVCWQEEYKGGISTLPVDFMFNDNTQALAAASAEIERLKASKAHILEDAKQAREAVRQLREDDKTLIDQLRREKAEAVELLNKWSTWACGQQGPSPFQETRTFLGQQEQRT